MSRARLVITAVVYEKRRQAEVAPARYGVHRGWVYKLMARYKAEGEAAFEPRSRRPKTSPTARPAEVDLIVGSAKADRARPGRRPRHHRLAPGAPPRLTVSRATISRYLQAGLVAPEPKKRPKSSYIRFAADAQRVLAGRLHPLPAAPPRRPPGADVRS